MEARPRLLVVVALLAAAASAAGASNFNAKNYGAKGNGVNDDTKVSFFPFSISAVSASCALTPVVRAAPDDGVEGGVRRRRRGDAGDWAGDVLRRSPAVSRAVQGLHHYLPAPGKSIIDRQLLCDMMHDRRAAIYRSMRLHSIF
jgi:hypothetical protein